jgi:hypothetical protein
MVAFTAGAVLTAASLNSAFNQLTTNSQTGTTYTLVLSDQGGLVTLSNASAVTVTVPTNASVAFASGTKISLLNLGAGTVTVSGAGVTISGTATIAQNEAATLVKTGLATANTWSIVSGGGVGAANFSNAATGTYTGYKYVTFSGNGSLIIDRAGFVDLVAVAGGGGAINRTDGVSYGYGGGGAGGVIQATNYYLAVGTYTVTIGAGGVGNAESATDTAVGPILTAVGGAGLGTTGAAGRGGSGGGGADGATGGNGTLNQGNNGGTGSAGRGGGGGGKSAVGTPGSTNPPNGGAGTTTSIAGTTPTGAYVAGNYAIGGGGGGGGANSTGGSGGGGNGKAFGTAPTNGTANTGGGAGGGGGLSSGSATVNGGSGIVIVRVAV